MSKRLFTRPPKDDIEKGIPSARWVMRAIFRALKKIQVTASSGVTVGGDDDGHVHLDLTNFTGGAGSGVHPFKVELTTNPTTNAPALKIYPGAVIHYTYTGTGSGTVDHTFHIPRVGGLALNVPRYMPVAARVVMDVRMSGATGEPIAPFTIYSTNGAPPSTGLVRGHGDVSPQDGNMGYVIALVSGSVVTQVCGGPIGVGSNWNMIYAGP
jgi:hypothetical protein